MDQRKRYQIFVSSTFADLKEERQLVMQAILKRKCFPAGMELFPAIDTEQFEYIKKVIDDSDYYLLIIGARYGSMDEDGVSFTEKEFDYAVSKGIPELPSYTMILIQYMRSQILMRSERKNLKHLGKKFRLSDLSITGIILMN